MGPKKEGTAISVRPGALKGKSAVVTGEIEGQSRKSAEAILGKAGATIEASLNKKVNLLVIGAKAGQNKLDKAEKMGIDVRDWDDVIEEIQGEGGAEEPEADDDDEEEEEEEAEEKSKPQKTKAKATKPKANTKAKAEPAPKAAPSVSSDSFLSGKTVLITGTVPGHDRKSTKVIVEKAGATVANSFTKKVQLLIVASEAGPDKVSKAEDDGIETIQWDEVAEKLGLEVIPAIVPTKVDVGEAPESIDGLTIIITGDIEGVTRKAAQEVLEGAGATFAKSFNKDVELVVLGAKPGPKKLEEIAKRNLPTCTFVELVEKLGLEVEASEPPKKKTKKA